MARQRQRQSSGKKQTSKVSEARKEAKAAAEAVKDAINRVATVNAVVARLCEAGTIIPQEVVEAEKEAKDGHKTIERDRKAIDESLINHLQNGGEIESGRYSITYTSSEQRRPAWQTVALEEHRRAVAAETLLERALSALQNGSKSKKKVAEDIESYLYADDMDEAVSLAVASPEELDETFAEEVRENTDVSSSSYVQVTDREAKKNGKKKESA